MDPKLTNREKEVIYEYGEMYSEMFIKLRKSLESKTPEELHEIINCFGKLGTTNCSWTAYEIRRLTVREATWFFHQKKKAEVSEDGSSKEA